jgi:hypothetical protein
MITITLVCLVLALFIQPKVKARKAHEDETKWEV